jgi:competence protein ComEA
MTTHVFSLALLFALAVTPSGAAAAAAPDAKKTAPASASSGEVAKVNINTADVKGLMGLSGVGQRVAERIVQYRDANGPFQRAEDLRKVDGIGTGLWERNRERIVIK